MLSEEEHARAAYVRKRNCFLCTWTAVVLGAIIFATHQIRTQPDVVASTLHLSTGEVLRQLGRRKEGDAAPMLCTAVAASELFHVQKKEPAWTVSEHCKHLSDAVPDLRQSNLSLWCAVFHNGYFRPVMVEPLRTKEHGILSKGKTFFETKEGRDGRTIFAHSAQSRKRARTIEQYLKDVVPLLQRSLIRDHKHDFNATMRQHVPLGVVVFSTDELPLLDANLSKALHGIDVPVLTIGKAVDPMGRRSPVPAPLMIPDTDFLESKGYTEGSMKKLKDKVFKVYETTGWTTKFPKAVWRGKAVARADAYAEGLDKAPLWNSDTWRDIPRVKMCLQARGQVEGQDKIPQLDAAITGICPTAR
ncbi:hypothetical protein CYMTET_40291 [Cymbomonas tetramitiformis]|uniref:Uncharacterized protein n=1 Tax=Cymbomonas tetramitiformis TaxID=36881 RepID=A0AAE0F4S2_9CHLO|nr:hypothetical protein CYMTET_40291 [Cymbomonas tetramitiformis]